MGYQQGGSGDRKNMDSVSGWGKAEKGDNARLRRRRNSGRFDGDRSGPGHKPKRKKTKTLRHLYMKFIHDVKKHAEHCESDRKHDLRMVERYGSDWKTQKRLGLSWHWRRSDWGKTSIQKDVAKIKAAGGDANYRRVLEM